MANSYNTTQIGAKIYLFIYFYISSLSRIVWNV